MATTYVMTVGDTTTKLPARTTLATARAKADSAHTDNPTVPVVVKTEATGKIIIEHAPVKPARKRAKGASTPAPARKARKSTPAPEAADVPKVLSGVLTSDFDTLLTQTLAESKRIKARKSTPAPEAPVAAPVKGKGKARKAAPVMSTPAPEAPVAAPVGGGGKYALDGVSLARGTSKAMALDAAQTRADETGATVTVTNVKTGRTVRTVAPVAPVAAPVKGKGKARKAAPVASTPAPEAAPVGKYDKAALTEAVEAAEAAAQDAQTYADKAADLLRKSQEATRKAQEAATRAAGAAQDAMRAGGAKADTGKVAKLIQGARDAATGAMDAANGIASKVAGTAVRTVAASAAPRPRTRAAGTGARTRRPLGAEYIPGWGLLYTKGQTVAVVGNDDGPSRKYAVACKTHGTAYPIRTLVEEAQVRRDLDGSAHWCKGCRKAHKR